MKNTKFIFSLLLLSVLFSCKKTETKVAETQKPVSTETKKANDVPASNIPEYAKISPPVEGLTPVFQTFSIDNSQSQTIKTPSGTEIFVPANAFLDKAGNKVAGEINIRYREFHDAADILLSGIPMEIQTEKGLQYLTTAGMFEIWGEKEGQAVQLAAGKKIKINFASQTHENGYDFFQFKENTTGWEKIGTSTAQINPAVNAKLRELAYEKEEVFGMPLGKDYFAFDYNTVLDIMFNNEIQNPLSNSEVNQKTEKYGFHCYNVWCNTPVPFEGNEYPAGLMLWKHHEGVSVPAWVDRRENAMEIQLKETDEKNVYDMECSTNGKFFSTRIEAVVPLKSLFAFSAEEWTQKQALVMEKIRKEEIRIKAENAVIRSFEIAQFGIYNYDKYLKEEGNFTVKGDFTLPQNAKSDFGIHVVFFLPEDNRSVIKLTQDTWDKVVLLPKNKARFVCFMPNQEIGVFSANQYQKLPFAELKKQEKPAYSFALESKGKIGDANDIRKILRF